MNTILVSLLTIGLILVIYKYVFNPQVIPRSIGESVCPDNWLLSNGLCEPQYETNCAAFDPNSLTSSAQACNIARSCGTGWPGKCP